jgi:hypothetical protein
LPCAEPELDVARSNPAERANFNLISPDRFLMSTHIKKTILIAIAGVMPTFASFAQELRPMAESTVKAPNAVNSWQLISAAYGPFIPAGWQIAGIEGVIYQGNSINRWQVYLYNPSTRQTAGWLIQIN